MLSNVNGSINSRYRATKFESKKGYSGIRIMISYTSFVKFASVILAVCNRHE